MGRARHLAGLAYRRVRPKRGDLAAPTWAISSARRHPNYEIGPHCYGPIDVYHAHAESTLVIGDYCSFASETSFWLGGEHRSDWVTTYPFNMLDPQFSYITGHPSSRGDIRVGSDVWTGWRSTIMSGVTIGHGAVIATGAVVVKDVAPYTIVGGVPAKKIGQRFDDETIAQLLEIAWWEWDEASVEAAVPFLQSDDVDAFITEVREGRLPLA